MEVVVETHVSSKDMTANVAVFPESITANDLAGTPGRILSLDGGGAKGFYTLGVLAQVEAMLKGKLLCDHFRLDFRHQYWRDRRGGFKNQDFKAIRAHGNPLGFNRNGRIKTTQNLRQFLKSLVRDRSQGYLYTGFWLQDRPCCTGVLLCLPLL